MKMKHYDNSTAHVDRATARRTLRKRLSKMDDLVGHSRPNSLMREVLRNQRAIMKFLLIHLKKESV